MAQILSNGLIQFDDGRILYSDTPITGQDWMELQELLPKINPIIGRSAMVGFPFVSGGGGGAGSPGPRGNDGAPGPQGVTGVAGGGTGPQGETGLQGVTGPTTGVQGDTGVQGVSGQTGVQGTTGSSIQGATGVQGTQGQTGVAGQTGVQGQTGPGTQGTTGTQGIQGATGTGGGGATGVQGQTGVQGVQGATGTGGGGATGVQGVQGQTGVQGATGASGSALFQNVQENTLTTLNATPTVILTETIAALSVGTFRVVVDARYDDGSLHASFVRTVKVVREGGGAILGTENADYTDDESLALTATFTVSGNDIQVTVIGVAATSITWKARMGRVILP